MSACPKRIRPGAPGTSDTMRSSTASSSMSSSSPRSSSVSSASAARSNSRPSTDAAASASRQLSESRAVRRPITVRTLGGIRSGSACSASLPSPSSRRTSSPTKSGLPFVSAPIAATSPGAGSTPVARSMYSAIPSLPSPRGSRRTQIGSRSSSASVVASGLADRRVDVAERADDQHARCPRSRARRTAAAAATARRRRACRRARSAAGSGSAAMRGSGARGLEQAGSARPRSGRARAASAPAAALPARAAARADHGQYAGAPPASQQRPTSARTPWSRARAISSSASRRLADAGLAGEQHDASAAGAGVGERRRQHRQLAVAADERARARLGTALVARRGRIERRVLAQDRLLQVAQLTARLQAELARPAPRARSWNAASASACRPER